MRYSIFILFFLLVIGCRSPENIAARKAAKDAAARQKEMVQLQKVREALPCVPVQPLKQGITQYLPGEKIPCNGRDSVKCPDQKVRVDTLQVEDQAALKAVRDSLAEANLKCDKLLDKYTEEAAKNDKLQANLKDVTFDKNAWKKRAWLTWVGISLVVGGGIFSKIKGFI
ncbi:hypothetical protein [Chitinophaga sp.]|uniref:hypothetical protein n=1 Tax=Chitinophaga sp. TaxID=1869181 RepID=UPI0031E23D61